ncbi:acyltransferase domain-containing protein [Acaricomes phytoseiuli]|uniref:acyltransferase domain-containing protein n=1 Tax=Acaricomes phytoseiuli TaxID=291968 RepID=UPI00037515D6|nr:acyltransferase domain-containing protein [Acaricomes phytoseiuli]
MPEPLLAGSAEQLLELAAFEAEDYAEAVPLLATAPDEATSSCLQLLRERLGRSDLPALSTPPSAREETRGSGWQSSAEELLWLEAYLRFLPEQLAWYRERNIPDSVIQQTMADIGRQTAISRRTLGRFGIETWQWLAEQASGMLYQLGRLQFQLGSMPAELKALDGEISTEANILNIHIPESGPLTAPEVLSSLLAAPGFFAEFFPEQPVRYARCVSWLLDPYLVEQLPAHANISQFSRLFTPYGTGKESNEDAVYFVFRTREHHDVSALPRATTLQRIVTERIESGGSWRIVQGYLDLGGFS